MFGNEKELEKKYNYWDKNIKMLADVASVEYGIKLGDSKFSINNSFRRVLDALENSDVYISYIGNYEKNYHDIKFDIESYMEKFPKYREYFKKLLHYDLDNDIELVQKNFVNKFNWDPIRMEKITIDEEKNREYNLIDLFIQHEKFDMLNSLLLLDVNKNIKRKIVGDVFKSLNNDNIYFDKLFSFMMQDKYRDVIRDYCESLSVDSKKDILENSSVKLSLKLQKDNLIDFNDGDLLFSYKDKSVAPVVKLLDKSSSTISNIELFYRDSYLDYSDEVRRNTDSSVIYIILNKYHSISHAKEVLKFENFKINDKVIDTLTKYFLDNDINYEIIDDVVEIITNKSRSSREYRDNKKYVDTLLINTDKERLKKLREKLVQTLYKTIDSNINMKVKDIKVYKKN